ncbi:glycine cleavage system aminomethyltransferase GcvT [Rhodovulum sp. 12E13]|uniref:glycine cleavage system aminomethyltransferase GcvT n=1 Tax=Rhodovulum sp. 12E13 TaxID=2203891 RepID=UPI000E192F85|nr:glycine cleavage system aminomethyltransferase GcvT [Rhodovulum sp. 12E13]RDC71186.1 glycine cleavage system aminomethyltransferase GcvT [Rhodovulum sp. 12E13]
MADDTSGLQRTPLAALHVERGGRMVPFAGWEMPVQFEGTLAEHRWTRARAGLFDVSHMGQVLIEGAGAAEALERLAPQALLALKEGRQRYAFFTSDEGGLLDDLMVAAQPGRLLLVVNAARKADDLRHLAARLADVAIVPVDDRALIALQGPQAEAALARVAPDVVGMRFMDHRVLASPHGELWVSRSGYTGEDGFEVSVAAGQAEALARALLEMEEVAPIGLGARDSLRLEAGLCLYGADIDETTSPVEAGLGWAIQKVRRRGGARAGGFPGAERILRELEEGPARLRVGLRPEGRAPMRAGVALYEAEEGGEAVGHVTSGTFGPSVGAPVAMGYVPARLAAPGARLFGEVRGKRLPAIVAEMPFHPHGFRR